jgi:hypothetical protein
MSDLLKLAERCEAATGPDRELDGAIVVAIDGDRQTILYNEPGPFPQKAVRGPIRDLMLTGDDLASYINAPTYTASLDAATTLVPEGMSWGVGPRDGTGKAWAWVGSHDDMYLAKKPATPALALCAASLRARAEIERLKEVG